MARSKTGPEAEMEALHQKRVELATKRHAVDAAASAAEAVINGAQDRRRAVLLAEARGDKPDESVDQVDQDRRTAELTVADCRERAAALRQVESEIGEAADAVVDRNPEHYLAKRGEAVETALGGLSAALDAVAAAVVGCRAARADGEVVRRSCRRRGIDVPAEPPLADLGGAVSEISRLRQVWERFGQPPEPPKRSLSVGEAREQIRASEPASEPPLLEMIG